MMIDPNRGQSKEVLERLKAASYERFRIELFNSIDRLLDDYGMTWDDLGKQLKLRRSGQQFKKYVGTSDLTIEELNEIAHIFSAEVYMIFRPRFPFTAT